MIFSQHILCFVFKCIMMPLNKIDTVKHVIIKENSSRENIRIVSNFQLMVMILDSWVLFIIKKQYNQQWCIRRVTIIVGFCQKSDNNLMLGIGSTHHDQARFECHCNQCLDTMDWVLSIFLRGVTLSGNWDLHNVVRFFVGCQSRRCTSVMVL